MTPTVITYCLSHTLILTRRCAYDCGYCDYKAAPSRPLPSPSSLGKSMRRSLQAGATQLRLTSGEGIEHLPETISVVRFYGKGDFTDYLRTIFRMTSGGEVSGGSGLFPTPDVGNLSFAQLHKIKGSIASLRILLESADPRLLYGPAHAQSPCKDPRLRLDTILNAGKAGIPLTTGILVGIGESRESRDQALRLLAEAHAKYGHIQNVAIERFRPRPGTPMASWPLAPAGDVIKAVDSARRIFHGKVPVTVTISNNMDFLPEILDTAVSDFGEIEVGSSPAADAESLQSLHALKSYCESRGVELRERLPVFPSHQTKRWLSPEFMALVRRYSAPEAQSVSDAEED